MAAFAKKKKQSHLSRAPDREMGESQGERVSHQIGIGSQEIATGLLNRRQILKPCMRVFYFTAVHFKSIMNNADW